MWLFTNEPRGVGFTIAIEKVVDPGTLHRSYCASHDVSIQGRVAARRARLSPERKALQARVLAKWRSK